MRTPTGHYLHKKIEPAPLPALTAMPVARLSGRRLHERFCRRAGFSQGSIKTCSAHHYFVEAEAVPSFSSQSAICCTAAPADYRLQFTHQISRHCMRADGKDQGGVQGCSYRGPI